MITFLQVVGITLGGGFVVMIGGAAFILKVRSLIPPEEIC